MEPFPVYPVLLLSHPRWPRATVVAEFALPTGSFKDRGAAAVAAQARRRGARRLALDSSGNAALAVAAAAAREGLPCVARMTSSASPTKIALVRAAGASVEIFASRREAAAASLDDRESYDASHVRNPVFRAGVSTLATSWNDSGPIPATIYVPVGNGSLLLGLRDGFSGLVRAGRLSVLPRLVAVQPAACCPVVRPESPGDGRTIADGCAVLEPPAASEIREAVAATGGRGIVVGEDEIRRAWFRAWRDGFPVEASSALAFAAAEREAAEGRAVAILATGSGLKGPPE
jgi:threonine synthase